VLSGGGRHQEAEARSRMPGSQSPLSSSQIHPSPVMMRRHELQQLGLPVVLLPNPPLSRDDAPARVAAAQAEAAREGKK